MGARHPTVEINPAVFKWAVAGSGWGEEELSDKTDIDLKAIQKWGQVSTPIRVGDLKKISKAIGRPVSVLLLTRPPNEKNPIDYRRIEGTDARANLSKEILQNIRRARYVQSSAGGLLEMRSEEVLPKITPRTLKDDPEEAADAERKKLGLGQERRVGEGIDEFARNAYKSLRKKIESLNIFVMQMPMDVSEARGFALSDTNPKVIAISSKDGPRPKLFTLLHEYAHILLSTDGICTASPAPADGQDSGQAMMSVERWCNNFAGAAIMPRETILHEMAGMVECAPERAVSLLARKFCASKAAIAVRILNLLEGDPRCKEYREYYESIRHTTNTIAKAGGGDNRNMAKECINQNGARYVRLVCDSGEQDLITINDMVAYLDLKTKHFEKLEGYLTT